MKLLQCLIRNNMSFVLIQKSYMHNLQYNLYIRVKIWIDKLRILVVSFEKGITLYFLKIGKRE